jgi:hypothetical protein
MMDLCNNWLAIQQEELDVRGLAETSDTEQAQPVKVTSPKAAKKPASGSRNNGNSSSSATSGRKKTKGA